MKKILLKIIILVVTANHKAADRKFLLCFTYTIKVFIIHGPRLLSYLVIFNIKFSPCIYILLHTYMYIHLIHFL